MELDHYAIDTALSSVTVRAFANAAVTLGNSPTLMMRDFTGWARFTPATFEQGCVHVKVKAASLTVVETISEKERNAIENIMAHEVLEIEKYPEILFCSSRVSVSKAGRGQFWINLVGDLSLHGVTATLPLAAQVGLAADTLRAYGEFTFLHRSYKMKLVRIPGGTLKLKDEVKCSFDILARKQADLASQEGPIFAAESLYMCLAIPAKIVEFLPGAEQHRALVEVAGVRRHIDTGLLQDEALTIGDWVLIHVGFA